MAIPMEIYALRWKSEHDIAMYQRVVGYSSSDTRERIQRYTRQRDAFRTAVGEALVRVAAGRILGIRHSDINFKREAFGKPYIEHYPRFHFNLSHAGDWVVCVINNSPVGIDIEKIKPITLDIARYHFSKIEYHDLMLYPEQERLYYFYDLWTLKESYLKMLGTGLSTPLDSFSIRKQPQHITMQATQNESGITPVVHFLQYPVEPSYVLSVCALTDTFPDTLTSIDRNQLCETVGLDQ